MDGLKGLKAHGAAQGYLYVSKLSCIRYLIPCNASVRRRELGYAGTILARNKDIS